MSSTTGPSSASSFLTTHRQTLIIASAALATVAAGASIYYLSSPASAPSTGKDKRKKKKSKKGGAASSGGSGGEQTGVTEPMDEDDARIAGLDFEDEEEARLDREEEWILRKHYLVQSGWLSDIEPYTNHDTLNQLNFFPSQQRQKLAVTLKGRGNKAYSAKRFTEAIEYYSKAIECEEQAVFYSNRAACFTNLGELQKVVDDCSDALRLDPSYIKALNRRATAREQMGGIDNLYLSLCDFTAAAIIDNFATESTQVAVERVMKRLATEKAAEIMKTREPRLPSATFIKAYL
ncbi:hypothetical protein P7C70_g7316, partial [Phenoliferia sp. Uapishka_3]